MARNDVVERVFSESELNALQEHKIAILDLRNQAEGIALSLSFHLWDISTRKLYEIETREDGTAFKGIGDYAEYSFGISKGTTSDSVATFERFGNRETRAIADKWKDYSFSNLMAMKKLKDDEIEIAGITASDSKATIKAKIDKYKLEMGKVAMLPDKRKEVKEAFNDFRTLCNGDSVLSEEVNKLKKQFDAEIKEKFGVFSDGLELESLAYDELATLANMAKRYIDKVNVVEKTEAPSSTVEQEAGEQPKDETPEHFLTIKVTGSLYAKIVNLINKETKSKYNAVSVEGDTIQIIAE